MLRINAGHVLNLRLILEVGEGVHVDGGLDCWIAGVGVEGDGLLGWKSFSGPTSSRLSSGAGAGTVRAAIGPGS